MKNEMIYLPLFRTDGEGEVDLAIIGCPSNVSGKFGVRRHFAGLGSFVIQHGYETQGHLGDSQARVGGKSEHERWSLHPADRPQSSQWAYGPNHTGRH